jgi:N-acetyl-anhydromuramyl-L-alanine amidase AmpD
MLNYIPNPNDHFTWRNAFDNGYRGGNTTTPSVKLGKVVNVTRESHLAQTYNVEELETGALLQGCRYISPKGGFNGVGQYASLEEGTGVTVTTNSGMWDDCYITGTFYVEGNHNKYYSEGKLQEPGELETSGGNLFEFNQPSGHPNRIVQPDAFFNIYPAKNLISDFSSPEFTNNIEDKAKANSVPGSIEMRNQVGDIVNYAFGNIIDYTDSNKITISAGSAESKCAKLLQFAAYYSKQAELLEGLGSFKETKPQETSQTLSIKPILTVEAVNNSSSNLRSPFTDDYFIQQYKRLAQLYIQQAQSCNRGDASRQLVALQMEQNLGSELPKTQQTQEGQQTKPDYKPKETKSAVDPNNFGDRIPNKFKPIIVLHETDASAESVIGLFQNPKSEVSYHVMIKLDGSIVNFTDPRKRAYGASPSQFNGEFEVRTRTDGKTVKSVNSFAYHISFESPTDGVANEKPSHSGYTEAQYMSAAWLTARTGVPLDRITTHKFVDIGQGKQDPRSFDRTKFEKLFNSYPKTKEIFFDIPGEEDWIKTQTN